MPKVSVILSSYNHEKYIAAAIESVLNQTFTDFEFLIFDDGSADNSQKIIQSYNDPRIKLFLHKENIGPVKRYLDYFKIAAGEYIAMHHSDDIWESTKLEKQVDFLEKNPQYEVCFTQVKFIDEDGEFFDLPENHPYKKVFKVENRTREEWLNYLFWKSNCFCHPSILIRNAPENLIMDPCLFQLPDYLRWINFCLKKSPYVLPDELIYFRLRRGEQNSTSSWSVEKLIRIQNENYFAARAFLPILRDEKFFLKVFPEAEEFLIGGEISTEFAFAQLCLKRNLPAFPKLALEILYDLLHNDDKRNLIKKLYGYDEKNFIHDTGKFDVFGSKAQLPVLNCRLYFDFGEGFNERDLVEKFVFILPDGNFLLNFDFPANKEIQKFCFCLDSKIEFSIKLSKITVNGETAESFAPQAFQFDDGYFYFFAREPSFIIDKKISAEKIHVEILGSAKNDVPQKFKSINDKLQNLLNSKSWKVTKPLRAVGSIFRKLHR